MCCSFSNKGGVKQAFSDSYILGPVHTASIEIDLRSIWGKASYVATVAIGFRLLRDQPELARLKRGSHNDLPAIDLGQGELNFEGRYWF